MNSKNPQETTKRRRVLLVDDDPVVLRVHGGLLKQIGVEFVPADSVALAQEIIRRDGTESFDCVITDYLMPEETGIDLIHWLQNKSSSLTAIMATAQEERNLITETLRSGAVDFLDKPVSKETLEPALLKACELTTHRRALAANYDAVQSLVQLRGMFCSFQPIEEAAPPKVVFFPKFELGGDFVNLFPLADGQFVLLCGDVSGHDLKAAYISSYFQGMVRALAQKHTSIPETIRFFNDILIREWNESTEGNTGMPMFSLATAFAVIDRNMGVANLLNCGLPHPFLDNGNGRIQMLTEGSCPLGWFDEIEFAGKLFNEEEIRQLFFFTDGALDLATSLEINTCSLVYRLLHSNEKEQKKIIQTAPDDILIINLNLEKQTRSDKFEPVLCEALYTEDAVNIDACQAKWEQSLRFALAKTDFQDRFYDVIVCCREAVLNGIEHGCAGLPNEPCWLQISYCTACQTLRIRVDDPGPGHQFNIEKRMEETDALKENHMGLMMLKNLSNGFAMENNGATIIADFNFQTKLP